MATEIDTKKNTSTYNKNEWKKRIVPHKYLEDVNCYNQKGLDNFSIRSTKNKLANANSQWNGVNYWAKNVIAIKAPEGPRNFAPIQIHPVVKPGNGNPWAPYKFSEPPDNYRTVVVSKYIQY